MERVNVRSSQIASIGYDEKTKVLEIEFNAGRSVYQYKNVDKKLYMELMQTESIGGFFTSTIKKNPTKYPFVNMGAGSQAQAPEPTQASTAEQIAAKVVTLPDKAKAFVIKTNEHYAQAAEFLKGIKGLRAEIDAAFDPIIGKAHEAHKIAIAQKKKAEDPLVVAEGIIKRTISGYLQAQERARLVEEQRIRSEQFLKIKAQAEEENLKRAQELAEQGRMDEAAEAVDAEVEIPHVPVHVESSVPKVQGISMRRTFHAEVVDLMKLVTAVARGLAPLQCLQPNMVFLNAQARAFKAEGPLMDNKFEPSLGVEIKADDGIAAGRS